MKPILIVALLCCAFKGFSQTAAERNVLELSARIFKWEVNGSIDSLDHVFHDQFFVVGSTGESQSKKDYIARLRGGNFVHNAIDVEENKALVSDNTATVTGKGIFSITTGGRAIKLRLSYMEVFTRVNDQEPWKVLAMHASALPEASH